MGQYIVKLKEHYLVWSSIVDAPISRGMTLTQLKRWTRRAYGQWGMDELPARLERVDRKGTSAMRDTNAVDTIWLNRAGPDESCLTIVGIYRHFCLGEEIKPEWIVSRESVEDDDHDTYADVVKGWDELTTTSNT